MLDANYDSKAEPSLIQDSKRQLPNSKQIQDSSLAKANPSHQ